VLSVTSEAAANAAFHAAPQWSTRSDSQPANDLFGALVNQNRAADNPSPPPPLRRSDETLPPADNAGPTNNASDQPAGNDLNGNANGGPPSNANANAGVGANGNSNVDSPTQPPATTPDASKTGSTKSTEGDKHANQDTSTVDSTILAQQVALTATTPNPVAVAIPVATPPTSVPAATPSSAGSTAPLAIVAAAIAASSQPLPEQPGSSSQVKTDPNAAPTTTPGIATAKVAVSANAAPASATPAIQATQTNPAPINAATLTSAVAATAPVIPKAAPAKPATATAATGATTNSGTTDPSASNVPAGVVQNGLLQQPAAGKGEAANVAVEGATADAAAASTSALSAHEHSPAVNAGHPLADSPDQGTQTIGTFQPQLNSTTLTTPSGALSVTAATNGPVPLSGLAVEIAASVKSGKSRFEIRLDPADLGRIDVRIDIDRNGQVTSHLTVEKPETLSMLRQDAPQLQRALDDAGLKTGNGGLQFSLRDQSSYGQNSSGNDSSQNAQRLIISDEDAIPAAVAGRTYGRSLGSSSGVDIRV
jgi:flagellar hook-length control protein FliK